MDPERHGRLDGRVVLVTGAASGIGRATVRRAAAEGARLGAIDVDAVGLATLVGELAAEGARVETRTADVTDPGEVTGAVDELVSALGPLHATFANAGTLTSRTAIEDLDLHEWRRVIDVDLTGVMLTFRASVPHFPASGGALIACGSSLAIRPGSELLPYVVAKAGVHAMARSLALELAPRSIRVNVVAPGLADTPMTRGVAGHLERGLATVPEGRLVAVDDVAAMVVHLMGDDAASITGAVVSVDAGRTAV